jgi:2-dehydropantoate 2-reductase
MRYIIIGAGAVGGAIGGLLFEAGQRVVLVARGAHLTELREHGLRLVTPGRDRRLPVSVAAGPAEVELQADDVLVLAVKTQHSEAALSAWADRPVAGGGTAGERLPVVCAQNGVENERLAARRFRRVVGMCVWLPSTHLQPGVVAAPCAPLTGILTIGSYPAGLDETVRAIGAGLDGAGLDGAGLRAPVVADVMRWKYGKLLGNLVNAIDAVAGSSSGEQPAELLRRARAEGTEVLKAAGIAHTDEEEQRAARGDAMPVQELPGLVLGGSSSRQSLARGAGSIEVDYLNGEIVLLGRLHGVATPVNEILQRLSDRLAAERRGPGELSAAELDELRAVIG